MKKHMLRKIVALDTSKENKFDDFEKSVFLEWFRRLLNAEELSIELRKNLIELSIKKINKKQNQSLYDQLNLFRLDICLAWNERNKVMAIPEKDRKPEDLEAAITKYQELERRIEEFSTTNFTGLQSQVLQLFKAKVYTGLGNCYVTRYLVNPSKEDKTEDEDMKNAISNGKAAIEMSNIQDVLPEIRFWSRLFHGRYMNNYTVILANYNGQDALQNAEKVINYWKDLKADIKKNPINGIDSEMLRRSTFFATWNYVNISLNFYDKGDYTEERMSLAKSYLDDAMKIIKPYQTQYTDLFNMMNELDLRFQKTKYCLKGAP